MEQAPPSTGYRPTLMRLRERVNGFRHAYRTFAIVVGLLTLFGLFTPGWDKSWPFLTVSATLLLVSAVGYRNLPKRPRFWGLVCVWPWNAAVAINLAFVLAAEARWMSQGEFSIEALTDRYSLYGLAGKLVGLSLLIGANKAVVSREEADLIEEHRGEWEAYLCGRRSAA